MQAIKKKNVKRFYGANAAATFKNTKINEPSRAE